MTPRFLGAQLITRYPRKWPRRKVTRYTKMLLRPGSSQVSRCWLVTKWVCHHQQGTPIVFWSFHHRIRLTVIPGKVLYPRSLGRASLKSGKSNEPFTASTISAIASLSKLMTSLAVLKVVEQGKLDLDADVQPMFTSTGQHDIITSLGGENNSATSEPDAKLLTLRSSWGTENGPLRLYGSYV